MAHEVTIPDSRAWLVPGRSGQPGLRVNLALPAKADDTPVHVVVVLDGEWLFLTAVEFARVVRSMLPTQFPPIAVVSVTRDEVDEGAYFQRRFLDFTPTTWTIPEPGAMMNDYAILGTGGASSLVDELAESVLPQVRQELNDKGLRVADTTVAGWSLSGLFACWAWLERGDLFDHLLAISPSLWWDDANLLSRPWTPLPSGRRAFVCAGEFEEGDKPFAWPGREEGDEAMRVFAAMVTNASNFARRASESGATVFHTTFTDEHHVTLQSAALARGLRDLFT